MALFSPRGAYSFPRIGTFGHTLWFRFVRSPRNRRRNQVVVCAMVSAVERFQRCAEHGILSELRQHVVAAGRRRCKEQ